ncbi:MAG: pantetheine-phosphate adenylyltransferase [Rhodomicrobium sp.]
MRSGFYPGSFDPPTLGHRDIMRRALKMVDRVVAGVGVHPLKAPMFTDDERVAMLEEEFHSLGAGDRAQVVLFRGLTVEAARKCGAQCIIRGLRDGGDLSYEMQMAGMNAQLAPDIETVFVAASPGTGHITATLVRQIASLGGDVSFFVSPAVLHRVKQKFSLS